MQIVIKLLTLVGGGSRDTHHYRIIMSTSHSENHSGSFISDPASRHLHLSIIPHPAHEVPQRGVLRDVIETGRDWHVNHWASLRKIHGKV